MSDQRHSVSPTPAGVEADGTGTRDDSAASLAQAATTRPKTIATTALALIRWTSGTGARCLFSDDLHDQVQGAERDPHPGQLPRVTHEDLRNIANSIALD